MAGRCKRTWHLLSTVVPADGFLELALADSTIEYLLRVVDPATFAGRAFTLASAADPLTVLHLQAGESYQEERIGPVSADVGLRIGAAAGSRAELVVWDA